MQLTTTTIKHKRYSAVGWNDKNPDGTLKNTLSQGEIGVLLGSDLTTVIEVRMGIRDGSAFNEGVLLGHNEVDFCIKQYDSRFSFPSIGDERILYIDKKNNSAWRWDGSNLKYECISSAPGQGDGWWKEVNGGGALIDMEILGTSSPINW